jgi:hypothetical protein
LNVSDSAKSSLTTFDLRFSPFLEGKSALALAPGPVDPKNVKLGNPKLLVSSRFFRFSDRFCDFLRLFARF